MNIRDIIKASLSESGHGGLYCPGEPCGCTADDLFPCANDIEVVSDDCKPGYRIDCDDCPRMTEKNCPVEDGGQPGGWCVGPKNAPPKPMESYDD